MVAWPWLPPSMAPQDSGRPPFVYSVGPACGGGKHMDGMDRDAPIIGSGAHRYRFVRNWAKLPRGWLFRDVDPQAQPPRIVSKGAVAANGDVFVLSRSAHPVVVFDPEGHFITSWGE